MSVPATRRHGLRIAFAIVATAFIAACDANSGSPTAPVSRATGLPRAIEGDTLACLHGWTVVSGRYVCNEA